MKHPEFPFHQGRFQGVRHGPPECEGGGVSIPPRKVSRGAGKPRQGLSGTSFHSTKEGFKAA